MKVTGALGRMEGGAEMEKSRWVGDIFRRQDWQVDASGGTGKGQGGALGFRRKGFSMEVPAHEGSGMESRRKRPRRSFWICRGWGPVKPSRGGGKQGAHAT